VVVAPSWQWTLSSGNIKFGTNKINGISDEEDTDGMGDRLRKPRPRMTRAMWQVTNEEDIRRSDK
jgi:hypothetical protein